MINEYPQLSNCKISSSLKCPYCGKGQYYTSFPGGFNYLGSEMYIAFWCMCNNFVGYGIKSDLADPYEFSHCLRSGGIMVGKYLSESIEERMMVYSVLNKNGTLPSFTL